MLSRKRQEELKEKHQARNFPKVTVKRTSETEIEIGKRQFTLCVDSDNAFDIEALSERYMPFFDQYDYIVGDWSFEQLRLKGFYSDEAHAGLLEQKITYLPDYIIEYCSFGCAYFVLEQKRTLGQMKQRDAEVKKQRQLDKKVRSQANQKPKRKKHSTKRKENNKRKNQFKIIDKSKSDNDNKRSKIQQKRNKRKPTTFEIR